MHLLFNVTEMEETDCLELFLSNQNQGGFLQKAKISWDSSCNKMRIGEVGGFSRTLDTV